MNDHLLHASDACREPRIVSEVCTIVFDHDNPDTYGRPGQTYIRVYEPKDIRWEWFALGPAFQGKPAYVMASDIPVGQVKIGRKCYYLYGYDY